MFKGRWLNERCLLHTHTCLVIFSWWRFLQNAVASVDDDCPGVDNDDVILAVGHHWLCYSCCFVGCGLILFHLFQKQVVKTNKMRDWERMKQIWNSLKVMSLKDKNKG